MKNISTLFVLFLTCSLFSTKSQALPPTDTTIGHSRDFIAGPHEISFRDDRWDSTELVPEDSGSYTRDANWNPIDYTYFTYSNSGWSPQFSYKEAFNSNNNIDTSTEQKWNAISSMLVNSTKGIYNYNGANLISSYKEQVWVNNTWLNAEVDSNIYDANNNLTEILYLSWNPTNNAWRDSLLYTNTYNGSNKVTQNLYQTWDTTNNVWINGTQELYTYDAHNNLLSNLSEVWDSSQVWDSSSLDIYTYDANNHILTHVNDIWLAGEFNSAGKYINTYDGKGNLISQVYQDSYDGINFTNFSKDDDTYDANNNKTVDSTFTWDIGTNGWDNWSLSNYGYNASKKMTSYETQIWSNGAFVNDGGTWYVYDSNGNEILYEPISWSTNLGWYITYKDSSAYDAHNNLLYALTQSYDTTTQTFTSTAQSLFWYSYSTGINNELQGDLSATLYPNPGNGKNIWLQLNLEQNGNITISIYDMKGRMINTESRFANPTEKFLLNYPDIGSGTYLLRLFDQVSGKSSSIKFVVQ